MFESPGLDWLVFCRFVGLFLRVASWKYGLDSAEFSSDVLNEKVYIFLLSLYIYYLIDSIYFFRFSYFDCVVSYFWISTCLFLLLIRAYNLDVPVP
jgi:hypothetical protein